MTVFDRIWLVWSHEHDMWWGPSHHGYTSHLDRAGRYSAHEAERICGTRGWRSPVQPPEVRVLSPEHAPIAEGADVGRAMQRRVVAATTAVLAGRPWEIAAAFLRLQSAYESLKVDVDHQADRYSERAFTDDDRDRIGWPETVVETYQETADDLYGVMRGHLKEFGDRGF